MSISISSLSLGTLPEELLVIIFQNTPHTSYPSIARVCKTFNSLVTPQLYRSVYFPGLQTSFDRDNYPKRHLQSRIFSISSFSHTISSSPHLGNLLRKASFEWALKSYGHDNAMKLVADLLRISLETLHLSTQRWPISPKLSALVTSLSIYAWVLTPDIGIGLADRGKFYSVFSLPRIHDLTISGIRSWNAFQLEGNSKSGLFSTSNLTFLSLKTVMNTLPTGNDLVEILRWPKRLRSFHLQISPPNRTGVDPSSFINALAPHRDCLEEFTIYSELSELYILSDRTVDLKSFPLLRRIGLPANFLVTPGKWTDLDNPPRIFESLPFQLEALQLEISREFYWPLADRDLNYEIKKDIDDVNLWFCDIAQNKIAHYPALKRVMVWHNGLGGRPFPNPNPYAQSLLTALRNAEIEFSWETKFEHTLFAIQTVDWMEGKV